MSLFKRSTARPSATTKAGAGLEVCTNENVDAKDKYGYTALYKAVRSGDESRLMALIAAGADVNVNLGLSTWDSGTVLHAAVKHRHMGCVKALLAAGADVDAHAGTNGWTALMYAADNDDAQCVRTLIAAGADINFSDGYFTALSWAGSLHPNAAAALRDAEAQQLAQNLARWELSGLPRRWVADHDGHWNHADWLQLLESLKRTEFWPMEPDEIGRLLEECKNTRLVQTPKHNKRAEAEIRRIVLAQKRAIESTAAGKPQSSAVAQAEANAREFTTAALDIQRKFGLTDAETECMVDEVLGEIYPKEHSPEIKTEDYWYPKHVHEGRETKREYDYRTGRVDL